MSLKKFGFFEELPIGNAVIQLKKFQSPVARESEGKALDYLKAGKAIIALTGLTRDLLTENKKPINPQKVYSDGEWAWTTDAIYYVEKYHIEIPKEFLQEMEKNNWACPQVPNGFKFELGGWQT